MEEACIEMCTSRNDSDLLSCFLNTVNYFPIFSHWIYYIHQFCVNFYSVTLLKGINHLHWGWRYSSVIRCLPRMCKALHSIPQHSKEKKTMVCAAQGHVDVPSLCCCRGPWWCLWSMSVSIRTRLWSISVSIRTEVLIDVCDLCCHWLKGTKASFAVESMTVDSQFRMRDTEGFCDLFPPPPERTNLDKKPLKRTL